MFDWFRKPVVKTVRTKERSIDATPPTKRQIRNFTAAQNGRLFSNWSTQPKTADETLKTDLRALRARSREQANNNDYAQRFLGLVESNVVGPSGFTLQSQPKDPNGSIDRLAAEAIEAAWRDWSKRENADLCGCLSLLAMQKLNTRTLAQDGEFIALHQKGRNKYGYSVQLVDPETLDVDLNTELKGGGFIRMGIEFNANLQPTAYYFLVTNGENYQQNGKKYKRVPASEVIHAFIPQLIGQKRGIPWMSTALTRMQMLQGFEDASITNARAGASKMGFITMPGGDEYTGDDVESDGSVVSDFEAGIIETLPEGAEFKGFDPGYPAGEFAAFMKACLRGISSGLNISYNSLANDLEGVNFSSIRAGVLEDREVWKGIQEFMIESFLMPVFQRWIMSALMREAITVNGRPLKFERLAKFENARFQGRRWDWVDPLKDISALEKEYQLKTISLSQIVRDKGRDPETVWSEMAKEKEILAELGLTPSEVIQEFQNTEE